MAKAYGHLDKKTKDIMTFDKWVDAVNTGLHERLGSDVRTEELSWDSAMWVVATSTVVASIADDEATASVLFDGGDRISANLRDVAATPGAMVDLIVRRLTVTV
jgi:hypothetical protein